MRHRYLKVRHKTGQKLYGLGRLCSTMRSKADKLRKKAELILAAKENPDARKDAKVNGIDVGKRVRYVVDGVERYGVVQQIHLRSVIVELSAVGLLKDGEDILVRKKDEIPFAGVLEILGDGRLAQPLAVGKPPLPMAPRRDKPYTTCDFDDSAISEVLNVKGRGCVALCRDHAKGPTDDEPAPFRFRLGLIFETYQNWPRPTEQELSAWASRDSAGTRSTGTSPPSGGRIRRRKARSR